MKVVLDLPSKYNKALKDGFWPTTRVAPSFEDEFTKIGNVLEDYGKNEHFVSQARDLPGVLFHVNQDLYEGYFVVVRPSNDDTEHPLWIARVLSNPNSNMEHPGCVLIQYFWPIPHNKNV